MVIWTNKASDALEKVRKRYNNVPWLVILLHTFPPTVSLLQLRYKSIVLLLTRFCNGKHWLLDWQMSAGCRLGGRALTILSAQLLLHFSRDFDETLSALLSSRVFSRIVRFFCFYQFCRIYGPLFFF